MVLQNAHRLMYRVYFIDFILMYTALRKACKRKATLKTFIAPYGYLLLWRCSTRNQTQNSMHLH